MKQEELNISQLGPCHIPAPRADDPFVDDADSVLLDPTRAALANPLFLEAAGPRRKIYFNAANARAAIVTCGGLCPGLNDVIRGLVQVLTFHYNLSDILGIRYGYQGLTPDGVPPIPLTPDVVEDIHQDGGTILGSSRGPQDPAVMVDFLVAHRINLLFTVGGDGTQRGALAIADEILRRNLKISVVGVPKTIDNDIAMIERTFGFETAVAMSQIPITCAHMEAKGIQNGIGLVKLMGRDSGFIAAHASLASSDVNLVLIPESPFTLPAVMTYLEKRLAEKAHAVLVVAEGAGQNLLTAMPERDASGNIKKGDIGIFLHRAIDRHLRENGIPGGVKYIDPSYTIRSAPASADDSVFCFQLAEYAVHAAMAGRTAMVVGTRNGAFVHVPTRQAVQSRKKIDSAGLFWRSVLDNTGQPEDLT